MTHINLEQSPNPDSKVTPKLAIAKPDSDISVLIGRYRPLAQSSTMIYHRLWTNLSEYGEKIQHDSESTHLFGLKPKRNEDVRHLVCPSVIITSHVPVLKFCTMIITEALQFKTLLHYYFEQLTQRSHPVSRSSRCPDAVFQTGQSVSTAQKRCLLNLPSSNAKQRAGRCVHDRNIVCEEDHDLSYH